MNSLQDALLLANSILKNELTLTIKNLGVTHVTTAQLKSDKKELKMELQQTAQETQICFEP